MVCMLSGGGGNSMVGYLKSYLKGGQTRVKIELELVKKQQSFI